MDPPNPRSVLVLLDEPPAGGRCSAEQGFTGGGCYLEDPRGEEPAQPIAWRKLENGDVEVGLACGAREARLIISADSSLLRNAARIEPAAEWPVEVERADDARATCTARR